MLRCAIDRTSMPALTSLRRVLSATASRSGLVEKNNFFT